MPVFMEIEIYFIYAVAVYILFDEGHFFTLVAVVEFIGEKLGVNIFPFVGVGKVKGYISLFGIFV